jgi:hypothetical protein
VTDVVAKSLGHRHVLLQEEAKGRAMNGDLVINGHDDGANAFIDTRRIKEIKAIGLIDGGELFDVFGISFGPKETMFRVRYEESGNCDIYVVPEEETLEQALEHVTEVFAKCLELHSTPRCLVLREGRARRWVKRLVEDAEAKLRQLMLTGTSLH